VRSGLVQTSRSTTLPVHRRSRIVGEAEPCGHSVRVGARCLDDSELGTLRRLGDQPHASLPLFANHAHSAVDEAPQVDRVTRLALSPMAEVDVPMLKVVFWYFGLPGSG
jgi:hypothetical protein